MTILIVTIIGCSTLRQAIGMYIAPISGMSSNVFLQRRLHETTIHTTTLRKSSPISRRCTDHCTDCPAFGNRSDSSRDYRCIVSNRCVSIRRSTLSWRWWRTSSPCWCTSDRCDFAWPAEWPQWQLGSLPRYLWLLHAPGRKCFCKSSARAIQLETETLCNDLQRMVLAEPDAPTSLGPVLAVVRTRAICPNHGEALVIVFEFIAAKERSMNNWAKLILLCYLPVVRHPSRWNVILKMKNVLATRYLPRARAELKFPLTYNNKIHAIGIHPAISSFIFCAQQFNKRVNSAK